MTPIAAETIIWLGVALATAFLFVVGFLVVCVAFFAVFYGGEDDVLDVQRFIALTEEARTVVPPGLPLFDADKAAAGTAAIERFRVKKDEARRALWESRSRRRLMPDQPRPGDADPAVPSKLACGVEAGGEQ